MGVAAFPFHVAADRVRHGRGNRFAGEMFFESALQVVGLRDVKPEFLQEGPQVLLPRLLAEKTDVVMGGLWAGGRFPGDSKILPGLSDPLPSRPLHTAPFLC